MKTKKKKFSVSKLALLLPYIMVIFCSYCLWYVIKNELNYAYLTAVGTVFVAVIGIVGYTTKWYMKKSALENEPWIRLNIMKDMLDFQIEHPEFNIYDKSQLRNDANDIIKTIKSDEQKQYEKAISEDLDVKINN